MPFHDLNINYTPNDPSLSTTLAFLVELGYSTTALTINVLSKLPPQLPSVALDRVQIPPELTILTRLTLTVSDTSQNHRINSLTSTYDILALRPTTEKAFQLCCSTLECDLISLDLTVRLPFPIRFKTVASALQRGVRFEINYAPGITGSSDARRNLISGAASLIRATRGRGIILSSEARNALGLRGPHDAINLATVWGLSAERGKEAVCEEVGRVVRLAGIKRSSFRGVVDVIEDGSKEIAVEEDANEEAMTGPSFVRQAAATTPLPPLKQVTVIPDKNNKSSQVKRKASQVSLDEKHTDQQDKSSIGVNETKQLSKREMKRQAKKARLDRAAGKHDTQPPSKHNDKGKQRANGFPIQHEILATKKNG